MPGGNGLPAEAYQCLTLHVKRRLAARLRNIVTSTTPIPPEGANLVHPLYKNGDWAQQGNWRPIVCATTEVKLVWTLILGRIAPAVFAHVPASMWGAMAGRSAHKAIFLQDTALDMNRYEMIVASLDVQGAFPGAPHRLLTEVWDTMGLPFLSFMTGYTKTRLYTVITAAGLTPLTGTDSDVTQAGAEGPFLYLLVTLLLAFELIRVYPGYAPSQLQSPLINFADNNLLTTATRHRNPANARLPTNTEQGSAMHQLTTTYVDTQQLLVHPRKLVGLADVGGPAPHIQKSAPLHLEDTTIHPGSYTGHATPRHRTSKQAGTAPRPTTPTCQGGPPVYAGPGILHGSGAQRSHRVPIPALSQCHDALRHHPQQLTKAWARHRGWPTSFPKQAMMAHWRYYGDNTGALVDTAYAKHAAQLLHRVRHNHQPEVCKAAAICIKEAQTARNACRWLILAQHGFLTSPGTSIWAQLQLLLPHHTHAFLTNHHCDQQRPLVPRTPGRREGHSTLRGGHHHHNVHHPHTDDGHGPVRSPPRHVPLRPAMASTPRLPSVPPRMRYEGRAHDAGTQGHRRGVQEEKFIVFSALCFASPAACCWCRVSCCLFLEMKSFGFDEIQSLQVTPG